MAKVKLLIIEDDVKVLDTLGDFLEKTKEFEIRKSSHGGEGMALINTFRPDLVILDVMLPEIDGFAICKNIQTLPQDKKPRIILLTALTSLLNKMEAGWMDKTGAVALFSKPVDLQKMLSQIRNLFPVGC